MYHYIPGGDFNSSSIGITFDSSVSSTCVQVSAFSDSFTEDPETFAQTITVNDNAVSPGNSVFVTIQDSNAGEVLIAISDPTYSALEANSVMICVEVISPLFNLQRDVSLSIMTTDGTAQGRDSIQ